MSNERRREPRIPFVAPVTIYSGAREPHWQAQDLSLRGGGMFVAAQALLELGTRVEIGFNLPGYELEIVTDAAVAWVNDPSLPDHDASKPKGMGLTFKDLEPEYHKVVLQYVQQRKEIDDELALLEMEVEGAAQPQLARPEPPTAPMHQPAPPPAPPAPPAALNEFEDLTLDDDDLPDLSAALDLDDGEELPELSVEEALPDLDPAVLPPEDLPDLPLEALEPEPASPPELAAPPESTASPESAAPPQPAAQSPLIGEDGSLINDLIADSLAELDVGEVEEPVAPTPERPLDQAQVVAAELAGAPVVESDEAEDERLAPGAVLGSYRIVKWLGSGGMGDVYLAEHTQLGRNVAIKRLRSEYAKNKRALQRFFDEARAVNRIQHENIVQITDFATEDEHVYCVMEFLEGRTLAEVQTAGGSVPLDQTLRIAIQVCDALEVVHKAGVVHRDLKPQNIMLIDHGGRSDCVKLLDFGVAKLKAPEGETSQESTGSTLLGTPGYMSPEQLLGNPVDHRADIYALGVILYQMAAGTNPFIADTWGQAVVKHATHVPPKPSELKGAPNLPAQLEAVILRCLEKDPDNRPGSVAEVSSVLRQLIGVVAAGGDLGALAARPPKKRRRVGVVAGLVVGLGGVAAAIVFWDRGYPV